MKSASICRISKLREIPVRPPLTTCDVSCRVSSLGWKMKTILSRVRLDVSTRCVRNSPLKRLSATSIWRSCAILAPKLEISQLLTSWCQPVFVWESWLYLIATTLISMNASALSLVREIKSGRCISTQELKCIYKIIWRHALMISGVVRLTFCSEQSTHHKWSGNAPATTR